MWYVVIFVPPHVWFVVDDPSTASRDDCDEDDEDVHFSLWPATEEFFCACLPASFECA